MIFLDSVQYSTFRTNYSNHPTKLADLQRGLTAENLRVESGKFQIEYQITLICTTADIASLRTSFDKTQTSNNALSFIDEEGVTWTPSAGNDDDTHRYSTGVFFAPYGEPKPATAKGWRSDNLFLIQITLLTVAFYGLSSQTGYLLTEAGDYLNTEAGNRVLWQTGL